MELRALAERILFANTLEEKLQGGDPITDEHPGLALGVAPAQPGRPRALDFKAPAAGKGDFPSLHQLENAAERGRLLHFFCNHELLATELMALVLLRFPDAPKSFRRGVWQTLREEQRHTRWYLDRMSACGQTFGELPVSGYFWRAVSGMRSPLDFVAGLSLTFEQANLDFARQYAAAFAAVGDSESARLLDNIYRDEIAHVAHGLKWFRRWKHPALDDWLAYRQQLVSPLSPARAKGSQLNVEGRRAAGLDPVFIAELDVYAQSKGRTPTVFWFNPLVESQLARGSGFTPSAGATALARDLANLPQFLARRDDAVLVPQRPAVEFLSGLKQAGFELPEFVEISPDIPPEKSSLRGRKLGGLRPWAWGPDSVALMGPLSAQLPAEYSTAAQHFNPELAALYSKAWSAAFLQRMWVRMAQSGPSWLCEETAIGIEANSLPAVEAAVACIRERGHHRVVVKAAFGLAGQAAVRLWEPKILPAQWRWIESALANERTVVVEPWLERIVDFSVQLELELNRRQLRLIGFAGLTNDRRGQFVANWVEADHGRRLPRRVESALRAAGAPANWAREIYATLCPVLEAELRAVGFQGPLGVDAFLYRGSDQAVRLKPIVEINPRYTMGRVALELMNRAGPGIAGEFRIINRAQLRALSVSTFAELARDWTARFPPRQGGQPVPQLREGVVFLNDPSDASFCVAVLAVGKAMEIFQVPAG